jgi:ubiquinone/menaquinone biosynthesis C-methylase UbiE
VEAAKLALVGALIIIMFSSKAISNDTKLLPEYKKHITQKLTADAYEKAYKFSSRYISERDLDPWIALAQGNKALDYGSGLGYSTEFLFNKGFDPYGVDINPEIIAISKAKLPHIEFNTIENNLPFQNDKFDLVFSSLVLLEIKSKEDLSKYAKEASRVLKPDGIFIAVTASEQMFNPNYKSNLRKSNFKENINPQSGDQVKIHLKELNLTFDDYFWTKNDYEQIFKSAGLEICKVHYPLGKKNEPYQWKDELEVPFILEFLAAHNCARLSQV